MDKWGPDAPILRRAYRYLNNDEARNIPLCQTTNSRNDTAPSHVKRQKGKREQEGKREEGRGRSESLFSLLYAERDQSCRAYLLPTTTSCARISRLNYRGLRRGSLARQRSEPKKRSGGTETAHGGEGTLLVEAAKVGVARGKGAKRSRGNQARHVGGDGRLRILVGPRPADPTPFLPGGCGVLDASLPPNIPVWLRPSRSNGRQSVTGRRTGTTVIPAFPTESLFLSE